MARAYLETAELVASERREGFSNVTAGLAILAGTAASDAICCVRLGRYHRGDDHRRATELLQAATPDGRELAVRLERLLGLKDTAHYGAPLLDIRLVTLQACPPQQNCAGSGVARVGNSLKGNN